jgi:hypothetical protein
VRRNRPTNASSSAARRGSGVAEWREESQPLLPPAGALAVAVCEGAVVAASVGVREGAVV